MGCIIDKVQPMLLVIRNADAAAAAAAASRCKNDWSRAAAAARDYETL